MQQPLNAYQRSALKAALRSFEESLQYSLGWVGSWRSNTASDSKPPLSKAECMAASQAIAAAQDEISSLRERLGLAMAEANPCVRIHAEMGVAGANLEEARSERVARHGLIAPDVAAVLDRSITRLAGLAEELAAVFAQRSLDEADVQKQARPRIEP